MGRRKTMYSIWLLHVVGTADEMINLFLFTELTTQYLHVLYVILMRDTSFLRRGNMAALMVGKDILITVETGMYIL
jgi:hypothetical protein